MAHLTQEVTEDVQRLPPFQGTFTHRYPLHRVRVHVLLLHLVLFYADKQQNKNHQRCICEDQDKRPFPGNCCRRPETGDVTRFLRRYLIWRDAVELWQQADPVFLFDQDALQSFLVLLNLDQ